MLLQYRALGLHLFPIKPETVFFNCIYSHGFSHQLCLFPQGSVSFKMGNAFPAKGFWFCYIASRYQLPHSLLKILFFRVWTSFCNHLNNSALLFLQALCLPLFFLPMCHASNYNVWDHFTLLYGFHSFPGLLGKIWLCRLRLVL